jgi:triosephosphate isomerase
VSAARTRPGRDRAGAARRPLIAGNWKMYKTEREAEDYIQALLPRVSSIDGVDVAICVPFTDVRAMVDSARGSRVEVYAQNMHQEPEGAFTGEVSPLMLSDAGVQGVVLGHSERREQFGESDKALALKVPAALEAGLTPILCVGETESEREDDDTDRKLRQQIRDDLAGVSNERLADVVIAYEPIWAIGTGKVASAEQAQEAIAFIRALVGDRDRSAAQGVRILYGGSVKPENAAELLAPADVDGALVGGASLQAESFAQIVATAVSSRTTGPAPTTPR